MMSKKKKQKRAMFFIVALLFVIIYVQDGAGRAGLPDSFNDWYMDNSKLFVGLAITMIFFMVIWGFHESKQDREMKLIRTQTQAAKEQRSLIEAAERIRR